MFCNILGIHPEETEMKSGKKADNKIEKRGKDLYRELYENVHDGIYRSTPEGKILAANPALVKMLGYKNEAELRNLNISTDIYVSSSARDKFLNSISKSGRLKDIELVLKRKDGTEITVLENSHATKDKNGKIIYYEGTLVDISERKSSEIALKESQHRYHTLIETSSDGISLFDLSGRMKYFNQRKKFMLGYKRDNEFSDLNTFEMIHPDDKLSVSTMFGELLKKGSIENKELRIVKKDGSFFWAEFNASVIKDREGNPEYIMDTMRDISDRKAHEEQLKLLKNSVDMHYDGAFWLDTSNTMVYVNDAACKSTGYRKENLLGKQICFVSPQMNEAAMEIVWKNLRKKGSFVAEAYQKRKDGTEFPVEYVSTYINFGGKEYNCSFARDITERKRTAEEMKLRIEQLRLIIDLVPSYIFAKDSDGVFLLANKSQADIFGLSPDQVPGKTDEDTGTSPELVKWYRKKDLETIKKGHPVIIPEEQVKRKDGTLGWFQTVKIPYKHPGYDKPAIIGVATDITGRKETEDELRKSEIRFRKLFESHLAVKLLIDPENGSLIDANKAASEFYGWSIDKLRKMKIAQLNTSTPETVKERMDKVMSKGSGHFETAHKMADGTLRDVEVLASRIDIGGKYVIHAIIHDITDKKRIFADLIKAKEKAEESDRLKTAFLHNVSHEIRTPMNAIVGFTSLLETPDLPEETRKQYIEIVAQSSNQLLSIITDIVDISNIETGHVRIFESKINVRNTLKKVTEQFAVKAASTKINLKYECELSPRQLTVFTDEVKLQQIITNLITNAFKFTKKGSITVGCRQGNKEKIFFVNDTGIGIKSEYHSKVFERFFQIDPPNNLKTDGTGLGLAICKAYAEMLGGKIWLESKPGKGSTFLFSIPDKA
jgi:PAS domain S-box-containing protein